MKIIIENNINELIKKEKILNNNEIILKLMIFLIFMAFIRTDIQIENSRNENQNTNINQNISNYINIAVNLDNKYIYPCITFLTSLLSNRANSTFYIIHMLTQSDLNYDSYLKVNSVIKKFGKKYSNVSFYDMGNQFNRATRGSYISKVAYYRIALPSLLPNVDKCIYMDTDVINFKDLSEMYNIDLNDSEYFCGILDFADMKGELKKLGIVTQKYMNDGIILMNLKAMRNNSIEKKLRKYVSSHFLNHHDQTAINAICHNNFKILPLKFALLSSFNSAESLIKYNNQQNKKYRYDESELIQAFYHPTSIHYAGFVKPFQKEYKLANGVYWWYYAKKSGYYEEILKHYEFKKKKVETLLKKIYEELIEKNYKLKLINYFLSDCCLIIVFLIIIYISINYIYL